MIFDDHQFYTTTLSTIIEVLGTFTFAISGIRHAAAKNSNWLGGFVCGGAVAIGGGTIRDVMLGVTPFWMTAPIYMICMFAALVFVLFFAKMLKPLKNAWFVFDTLGLALFTLAGMQKALALGHPFYVAIIMGTITGSAGGLIRDVMLNNEPVIFKEEIYAMASVMGGLLYWGLVEFGLGAYISSILAFLFIVLVRFLSQAYHITMPSLHPED